MTTQAARLAATLAADTDPALTDLLVEVNVRYQAQTLNVPWTFDHARINIAAATGGEVTRDHDTDLLVTFPDGSVLRWPMDLDPYDGAFSIWEPRRRPRTPLNAK